MVLTERGHRALPHTADVRIEAWAPSRQECFAEAVAGMVATFAAVPGDAGGQAAPVTAELPDESDEDALVALLDEVVYLVETRGLVPLSADAQPADGRLRVSFDTVDLDRVELVGAAPKAVTLHGLQVTHTDSGWSCTVTVDV